MQRDQNAISPLQLDRLAAAREVGLAALQHAGIRVGWRRVLFGLRRRQVDLKLAIQPVEPLDPVSLLAPAREGWASAMTAARVSLARWPSAICTNGRAWPRSFSEPQNTSARVSTTISPAP